MDGTFINANMDISEEARFDTLAEVLLSDLPKDASKDEVMDSPTDQIIIVQDCPILEILSTKEKQQIRILLKTMRSVYAKRQVTFSLDSPKNPQLPGTLYGMSILHRSHLTAPVTNLRLRRKHKNDIFTLVGFYDEYELSKSGAPKTAWDFAHVLLACSKDLNKTHKLVYQLWGPVVLEPRHI